MDGDLLFDSDAVDGDAGAVDLQGHLAGAGRDLQAEGAGLDRPVDAALLGSVLLPPPAAGARVLAREGGAGAGGAADAGEALGVERMDRDPVGAVVLLNLLDRPVGEGVDLRQTAVIVV